MCLSGCLGVYPRTQIRGIAPYSILMHVFYSRAHSRSEAYTTSLAGTWQQSWVSEVEQR